MKILIRQVVTIFVAKMIKAVWKKNLPVLEHVIRNVKQNSRIKEELV